MPIIVLSNMVAIAYYSIADLIIASRDMSYMKILFRNMTNKLFFDQLKKNDKKIYGVGMIYPANKVVI